MNSGRNFDAWMAQADIPVKNENGAWVDLETGFHYDSSFNYANGRPFGKKAEQPKELGQKASDGRAAAKMLGGKDLTGSMAQKEWAEKIRASKLERMTAGHANLALTMPVAATAKFWIEARFKRPDEIGAWLAEHHPMIEKLDELRKVWERSREMSELEHKISMHKLRLGLSLPVKRSR